MQKLSKKTISLINDDLYRPTSEGSIKPKYEGMINTYFAILGSIVSSFCTSPFFNQGKFVIQDILNSSFSGGIAVGGCCHLINHYCQLNNQLNYW